MPNPIVATVGPLATANTQAIVATNTPAAAGNLTLVTAAGVTLDTSREVLVTYGNELAARTITIYGYGPGGTGIPISETLTVPAGGGGTIATSQNFLTVTRVAVLAAWSAAMSVGTNGVASTPWFVIDIARNPISIALGFTVSGTVNYTLEETYDDPNVVSGNIIGGSIEPASNVPPLAWSDAVIAAKTTNTQGTITQPFFAWRLKLNSGTGSVTVQAIQAGFVGA